MGRGPDVERLGVEAALAQAHVHFATAGAERCIFPGVEPGQRVGVGAGGEAQGPVYGAQRDAIDPVGVEEAHAYEMPRVLGPHRDHARSGEQDKAQRRKEAMHAESHGIQRVSEEIQRKSARGVQRGRALG